MAARSNRVARNTKVALHRAKLHHLSKASNLGAWTPLVHLETIIIDLVVPTIASSMCTTQRLPRIPLQHSTKSRGLKGFSQHILALVVQVAAMKQLLRRTLVSSLLCVLCTILSTKYTISSCMSMYWEWTDEKHLVACATAKGTGLQ